MSNETLLIAATMLLLVVGTRWMRKVNTQQKAVIRLAAAVGLLALVGIEWQATPSKGAAMVLVVLALGAVVQAAKVLRKPTPPQG
jgi:multisubunit Na+/H+ antiporter MnhF subunit